MADTTTLNFKFVKSAFNKKPWQQDWYNTLDAIDAVLSRFILVQNFQGVWQNATSYTVGQRVADSVSGGLFTCAVAHTSNPINTFAQDRAANPTFWTAFTFQLSFRNTWTAITAYALGDIVVFGQKLAVATAAHTSSSSFVTDQSIGLWNTLIDGSAVVALPAPLVGNADQIIRFDGGALQYQLSGSAFKVNSSGLITATAGINFNTGATFSFADPTGKTNFATAAGLAIGTNVEAWSANLDALAAVATPVAADVGKSLVVTGTGPTTFGMSGPLFGLNNRIINGDMRVAQRNASQAGITTGNSNYYTVDRWTANVNVSTVVVTESQFADHPILGANGLCRKYLVTTADASVTATKNMFTMQWIEGSNVADIIGQGKATLAFWVKSPKTGIHCVGFVNNVGTRSYVAEYSVAVANTWQRIVITVDFTTANAAGVWQFTTAAGLGIVFPLMAGANFQTTANQWNTTAAACYATANQQNLCDTINNVFEITDVMFVPGTVAPVFERRPYQIELLLCQRYYRGTEYGINFQVVGGGPGTVGSEVYWGVPMRVAPTCTIVTNSCVNVTSPTVAALTPYGAEIYGTGPASAGVQATLYVTYTTTAEL